MCFNLFVQLYKDTTSAPHNRSSQYHVKTNGTKQKIKENSRQRFWYLNILLWHNITCMQESHVFSQSLLSILFTNDLQINMFHLSQLCLSKFPSGVVKRSFHLNTVWKRAKTQKSLGCGHYSKQPQRNNLSFTVCPCTNIESRRKITRQLQCVFIAAWDSSPSDCSRLWQHSDHWGADEKRCRDPGQW